MKTRGCRRLRSLLVAGIDDAAAEAAARLADRAALRGRAPRSRSPASSPRSDRAGSRRPSAASSRSRCRTATATSSSPTSPPASRRACSRSPRGSTGRAASSTSTSPARAGDSSSSSTGASSTPDFYSRVLHETARLPYGVTSSYGEIAAAAGNPRAHRAAGTALATNPIPIVVPCHRILRAGGVLGNYGGGPELKRWLLRHEGAIE